MTTRPRILPRICVLLDANGRFAALYCDVPATAYTVQPSANEDTVYRLTAGAALQIDPSQIDTMLAGEVIGHLHDHRDDLLIDPPKKRKPS